MVPAIINIAGSIAGAIGGPEGQLLGAGIGLFGNLLGGNSPATGPGTGPMTPDGGGAESLVGQSMPAAVYSPMQQALSYGLWIAFAFLAIGLVVAGAQLAISRQRGEYNPGIQRMTYIVIVTALLSSAGMIAGMIIG